MAQEYNGWTNYETWACNLWITNDEPTYNYYSNLAANAKDAYELGESIRKDIVELNPLREQASLYSDLLNGAISEIYFTEIARKFLEDR